MGQFSVMSRLHELEKLKSIFGVVFMYVAGKWVDFISLIGLEHSVMDV
jgi:hypothetical protein